MQNSEFITAALIIIGNEILSGRTQDANTSWIAKKLTDRGIILSEVRVVPDVESRIVEAVNALRPVYTYVFTTGGIGPTHDDITASSVAKAFDVVLEENKEASSILEAHYGAESLTPARKTMALIPVGASLIPNPVSAAPGFVLENVHVMAGIPKIMQAMMDHVIGTLGQGPAILSNTVSCNLPESVLAQGLADVQEAYPSVDIGSYPQFKDGVFGVSLVMRGIDKQPIRDATEAVIALIRSEEGTVAGMILDVGMEA